MCRYMRCCTVVYVETRVERLPLKSCFPSWRGLGSLCPATWTCHCVYINGMYVLAGLIIFKVKGNGITFLYTDDWTRNISIKCPEHVFNSIRQLPLLLNSLQFNDYTGPA